MFRDYVNFGLYSHDYLLAKSPTFFLVKYLLANRLSARVYVIYGYFDLFLYLTCGVEGNYRAIDY